MRTNANLIKGPKRRSASICLTASAAVILTLPAVASEAVREQRFSVASTWQLPREPKVVCTALSPDFATLAMMHTNHDVEIWSTATRTLQRKIAAHTKPADRFFAPSLLFSPDGQWLAVLSGTHGPLHLISAAGGTNKFIIGGDREMILRARFSADGQRLLVCGSTERVVSVPEGKPIGTFQAHHPGMAGRPVLRPLSQHGTPSRPIRAMASALSPDGSEVALGHKFWEVERWDVADGECRGFVTLQVPGLPPLQNPVAVLNYAPIGGRLVAVLNGNQWDVTLAEPDGRWRTLLHQTPLGQMQTVPRRVINDAFFTPDGKEVVLVAEKLELGKGPFDMLNAKSVGPEVQLLEAATGAVTRRLEGPIGCFFRQAWVSADGRRLMVLQRSYTMTPRTHAERQSQQLLEADLAATLLTVSLDGQPEIGKP